VVTPDIEVTRYNVAEQPEWDALVGAARSGHFLFRRGYMDYHADRFVDHSLVIRVDGRLAAVLPASAHGAALRSHGGLTFGGLVCAPRTGTGLVLAILEAVCTHLGSAGFTSLLYKPVPHFYHRAPAEEDLYALFRCGARLVRRDVSSTIRTGARLSPSKGRKSAVKVAERAGVVVERSHDFRAFMTFEDEQLQARHGVRAVHDGDEMALLASRFPDNIALWTARLEDELVAGALVYESVEVAHTQYLAASDRGRQVSALDLLLTHLIVEAYAHVTWFDFGISTEDEGRALNGGLIANKESYGARATVYDSYEIAL
jgi:hypothetical protein